MSHSVNPPAAALTPEETGDEVIIRKLLQGYDDTPVRYRAKALLKMAAERIKWLAGTIAQRDELIGKLDKRNFELNCFGRDRVEEIDAQAKRIDAVLRLKPDGCIMMRNKEREYLVEGVSMATLRAALEPPDAEPRYVIKNEIERLTYESDYEYELRCKAVREGKGEPRERVTDAMVDRFRAAEPAALGWGYERIRYSIEAALSDGGKG